MYSQRDVSIKGAYKLLRKYGLSEDRIKHCRKVAKLAKKYAKKLKELGHDIDLNFIYIGALLHDIGRGYVIHDEREDFIENQTLMHIYNEPDMHMFIGGKILRNEGLEQYARIAERHGFAKEAAITYGKPSNYEPETIEEKIITLADLSVIGFGIKTVDERLECLKETFTKRKLFWRLKHLEDAKPRIKEYEMELMILEVIEKN